MTNTTAKENADNKEEVKKIFFKEIFIKNYKCFKEESIKLNCPNGKEGSGLNILIGENGVGKTSVLEALNFLVQSKYISENKLSINDYYDHNPLLIEIIGYTNENFKCESSIDYYKTDKGKYFEANGIIFEAEPRKRKEANKSLSSSFSIGNKFHIDKDSYINKKGDTTKGKPKKIDSRDQLFDNSRIMETGIDILYFDNNRSKHLAAGTYKTIFDKIREDLNWRFLHKCKKNDGGNEAILKEMNEHRKSLSEIINPKQYIAKQMGEQMSEFFDNNFFKDIKIDFIDIFQPFSDVSLVIRPDEKLNQISSKSLGSGIEMIMTLFLLKNFSTEENKNNSIIYLIDEPELHLHPRAQKSLANLLLSESKEKQIIISTHSPYMFKDLLNEHSAIITFKKEGEKIVIENQKEEDKQKLFPWSPSWGEINFEAYNMPTEEFHNERLFT